MDILIVVFKLSEGISHEFDFRELYITSVTIEIEVSVGHKIDSVRFSQRLECHNQTAITFFIQALSAFPLGVTLIGVGKIEKVY